MARPAPWGFALPCLPACLLAAGLAAGLLFVPVPAVTLPNCPAIGSCAALYEVLTGHPPDHGIGG